jgi:hypothetical protein
MFQLSRGTRSAYLGEPTERRLLVGRPELVFLFGMTADGAKGPQFVLFRLDNIFFGALIGIFIKSVASAIAARHHTATSICQVLASLPAPGLCPGKGTWRQALAGFPCRAISYHPRIAKRTVRPLFDRRALAGNSCFSFKYARRCEHTVLYRDAKKNDR